MTDLRMTSGDSLTFDVYATRHNDITGEDDPVDLIGAKIWFTLKRVRRDSDASALIAMNSVLNPIQVRLIGPGTDGLIRITLNPAQTDSLMGSYPYDVQIKEPDGAVTTIVRGFLEVNVDMTVTTV